MKLLVTVVCVSVLLGACAATPTIEEEYAMQHAKTLSEYRTQFGKELGELSMHVVQQCYLKKIKTRERAGNLTLADFGRLALNGTVYFVLSETGEVIDTSYHGKNPKLGGCVKQVSVGWALPNPGNLALISTDFNVEAK